MMRNTYRGSRGFTLVELMVAMAIGLFISAGLVTLVGAMRRTNATQAGLSQLQDNERIAMTIIGDVIQSGGYFPNPTAQNSATALPVTGPFTLAGQAIAGNENNPDWIYVRYLVAGADNILNCSGNSSAVGAMFVNRFYIDNSATSVAKNTLLCDLTVGGGATQTIPLVSGVTDLQFKYGVKSDATVNNNSADLYLDANTVAAAGYWNKVISVKVTVTFSNPLSGQPNQPATISFTRVVAVMNKTGVAT